MNIHPKKLTIGIGGHMGPSFSVELCANNRLRYLSTGYGRSDQKYECIAPTDEQWTKFREALDGIGVWKWRDHYESPEVICDGTGWGFELAYDDVALESGGSNNYPGPGGVPVDRPESSREFRRFVRAVQKLLGGREFD